MRTVLPVQFRSHLFQVVRVAPEKVRVLYKLVIPEKEVHFVHINIAEIQTAARNYIILQAITVKIMVQSQFLPVQEVIRLAFFKRKIVVCPGFKMPLYFFS